MWDRQSLSSLLTLLGGVVAAVMVIAMQPEPVAERTPSPACHSGGPAATGSDCQMARAPSDR